MFYWLANLLVISLFISVGMIFAELFMKHGADDAVRAGELLTKGALRKSFWIFVIGLGTDPAGAVDLIADRFGVPECDRRNFSAVWLVDVRASVDQGGPGVTLKLKRI